MWRMHRLVSDEKEREYTRLVSDHSVALFRFSARRLDDSTSCEDVVAETFLIAWRRWDQLPTRERELPWLYGIAFRVVSNQRRSRDRRRRLVARMSLERSPALDGNDPFDAESLLGALRQLKQSEIEVLEFAYWEKLSYRDIALALGISENAVGIRITRAKKNLRSLLEPQRNAALGFTDFSGELEA